MQLEVHEREDQEVVEALAAMHDSESDAASAYAFDAPVSPASPVFTQSTMQLSGEDGLGDTFESLNGNDSDDSDLVEADSDDQQEWSVAAHAVDGAASSSSQPTTFDGATDGAGAGADLAPRRAARPVGRPFRSDSTSSSLTAISITQLDERALVAVGQWQLRSLESEEAEEATQDELEKVSLSCAWRARDAAPRYRPLTMLCR